MNYINKYSTRSAVLVAALYFSPCAFAAKKVASQKEWTENFGSNVVEEAREWQRNGQARPVRGASGLIQFPYGEYQPVLTCAPLYACEIALQAGEKIKKVIVGDSVRWILASAESGEGEKTVSHVFVKPREKNISTNLSITTNRRVYVLTLKAKESDYVSRIGFFYPEEMVQNWESDAKKAEQQAPAATLPLVSADQLKFEYEIQGDKSLPWHPIRAFSDGTRVYIQMPDTMRSSEAPSLLLSDPKGQLQLVNYRVNKGYYIVDKIFDRGSLIVGVGSAQKKIDIVRGRGLFSASWKSYAALTARQKIDLNDSNRGYHGAELSFAAKNEGFGIDASIGGNVPDIRKKALTGSFGLRVPLGDDFAMYPHIQGSTDPYIDPSISGGGRLAVVLPESEAALGYQRIIFETPRRRVWNALGLSWKLNTPDYSLNLAYDALVESSPKEDGVASSRRRGSRGNFAITRSGEKFSVGLDVSYSCSAKTIGCSGDRKSESLQLGLLGKAQLSYAWSLLGEIGYDRGSAFLVEESSSQAIKGKVGFLYDF